MTYCRNAVQGVPKSVFFLLTLLSSLVLQVRCLHVVAEQSFQAIEAGSNVTIMCQAEYPLTDCQFKEYDSGKFYELSRGPKTKHSDDYQYFGEGLETGQCGLEMLVTDTEDFFKLYVCRVRAIGTYWHHANSVVLGRSEPTVSLPVMSDPRTLLADPGSNAVFSYQAANAVADCSFKWQGQNEWVADGAGLEYTIDKSMMEEGTCNLTLHEVIPESSGFVFALITAVDPFEEKTAMHVSVTTLIVRDPPGKPRLKLQDCAGLTLPSCTAGPSRPAPIITWYQGDEVIRGDDEDEADPGRWVWEYEPRKVTQSLNARLTRDIGGKEITCTVRHVSLLPDGKLSTKLLLPTTNAHSNLFLYIIHLLIGVSTVLLAAAVTAAILIIYKYSKRTWCFIDVPK